MTTALTLAWRNVRRNRRRSLITIVSLACGLAAVMAGQSLIKTVQLQLIEKATGLITGHVQVLQGGVENLKFPEQSIARTAAVARRLERLPGIAAFERRVLVTGLASSKKDSFGVLICGVEPRKDSRITSMRDTLVRGSFPAGPGPAIALGSELAENLGVDLADSVVLMAQAEDGSMGALNFRVAGIFHTGSQSFDAGIVYVPLSPLQGMLAMEGRANDFVIRLEDPGRLEAAKAEIAEALSGLGVQTLSWRDVDHELVGIQKYQNAILKIMLLVVFAIVALGILNTLLMSLFERIREFGVLLAIGAKPGWIARLVLLESCLLGLMGAAAGLAAGAAWIGYYHWAGLRLPLGETLGYFLPFPAVLFLRFHWATHAVAVAAVFATCVLAALGPALRASRLKPADALRQL